VTHQASYLIGTEGFSPGVSTQSVKIISQLQIMLRSRTGVPYGLVLGRGMASVIRFEVFIVIKIH
jgi:hypothetical protein